MNRYHNYIFLDRINSEISLKVKTIKNLNQFIIEIRKPIKFTTALIINVLPGSINNLPRPDLTKLQLKKVFLKKRKV